MEGYLGEEIIEKKNTLFKDYTQSDWALYWIEMYGGFGGEHHKDWVLDKVAQILNGTEVIIKKAKWRNGTEELRFSLVNPTKKYKDWVEEITGGNPDNYEHGIAP